MDTASQGYPAMTIQTNDTVDLEVKDLIDK